MKKRVTSHRTIKNFIVHLSASSAFRLYSNISHQYSRDTKPLKLVNQLSHYQTLSLVREGDTGLVFSVFSHLFFDIENVPSTTVLLEYQTIVSVDVEYLAWLDVFRAILSSKMETKGQAELVSLVDLIPKHIQQRIFDVNKLTAAEISRLSGIQRSTIDRHLKTLREQ